MPRRPRLVDRPSAPPPAPVVHTVVTRRCSKPGHAHHEPTDGAPADGDG